MTRLQKIRLMFARFISPLKVRTFDIDLTIEAKIVDVQNRQWIKGNKASIETDTAKD